jgi:hypothetical protein
MDLAAVLPRGRSGPADEASTVRMIFESAALRDRVAKEFGAVEGLNQTLDRLEEQSAKGGGR